MDEALRIMRFPLIFTSIVGNFAVLIVLLRYRALRKSSSNMLIAQLAFSGLIVGIGLLIRGVQAELSRATKVTVFNRVACMLYGATTVLGMNLLQTTTVMITIDRLSAFAFPMFYRRNVDNERFSIIRFTVCFGVSIISFSGQFVGDLHNLSTPICSSGAAWTPGYRFYFMLFSASASILTIALSTIAMILYHHQIRISPQKKRNSVVITQTTIMVSYIIFWCIPTIIYLIAVILGYEEVIFGRITLVLASGSGFFASLNPFLFLWKHTEFRTLFLCFYCRKKSAKHASVSVAQNAQNTKKSTITRKANDTIIQSLTPP